MRKTFYFPTHIKDRLLKFRQRHEMMDEQVAIIRLLDAGLTAEEDKIVLEQSQERQDQDSFLNKEVRAKYRPEYLWPWPTFWNTR